MPQQRLAFLIDTDNTLLDNDRLKADLNKKIDHILGHEQDRRFWELYEDVREEEDVVDIPETVRRFHEGYADERRYAALQRLIEHVDFAAYLYPGALETLEYLGSIGATVIVSDGDPVFQLAKITNSGLAAAVDERVLIYVHKQQHFAEISSRYPADRYVMVDDKARILDDAAPILGEQLVSVFVCQGKYAHDHDLQPLVPPHLTVAHIADLRQFSAAEYASGQFHSIGVVNCLDQPHQ